MTKRGTNLNLPFDAPEGFLASGASAGIKANGAADLGIIVSDQPAVAVATTTTNRFVAAPIQLCRERLIDARPIRGVVVNSGNANAVTGAGGYRDARAMARQAELATGSPPGSFLVASTGIIGQRLPMPRVLKGIDRLGKKLSADQWGPFAEAVLTTDLHTKISSRRVPLNRERHATILGVAKGSGMMQPNMATMLVFLTTDYPLSRIKARRFLVRAVDESFHCLTIDGQTSTNDMVLLMSNPMSDARAQVRRETERIFSDMLIEVCRDLAQKLARDGEGATKLVTIDVLGAASKFRARQLALTVANSHLVKTAAFGENPNWGRIVQALGQSPVSFDPQKVSIKFQDVTVMSKGLARDFNRSSLERAMKGEELRIEIRVGRGGSSAKVWTCDMTQDNIKINAEYN